GRSDGGEVVEGELCLAFQRRLGFRGAAADMLVHIGSTAAPASIRIVRAAAPFRLRLVALRRALPVVTAGFVAAGLGAVTDPRADDVGLMPGGDLFANPAPGSGKVVRLSRGRNDEGRDRRAAERQFRQD